MTRAGSWSLLLVVVLIAGAVGGCEAFAFLAYSAAGKDEVPAVYDLPDHSTAVLVDDPRNRLGSPVLAGVVSANVIAALEEHGVVDAPIVPQARVAALAAKLADQFALTPVDQVGRLLDAEQVIYISVDAVTLRPAPGMYRPSAVVQVKVIDAVAGKRLFPPPPPILEPGVPSRGRTVSVEMSPEGIEVKSRGTDAIMARQLARQVGREVAQLFYGHPK